MAANGPRFFTQKKKEIVLNILKIGCSRSVAARSVQCDPRTIAREMLYDPQFARDVREAESSFQVNHRVHIEKASLETKYWRASQWSLERKYPNEWGNQPRVVRPQDIQRIFDQWIVILCDKVPDESLREQLEKEFEDVLERFVAESEVSPITDTLDRSNETLPENNDGTTHDEPRKAEDRH